MYYEKRQALYRSHLKDMKSFILYNVGSGWGNIDVDKYILNHYNCQQRTTAKFET